MHTDLDRHSHPIGERLRQLPPELPPPWNWQEYRRRARQRFPLARERQDWRPAALAAALVLVVAAVAVWNRASVRPTQVAAATNSAGRQAERPAFLWAGEGTRSAEHSAEAVAGLIEAEDRAARSQALESWLASLPREPAVVRVGTRAAVAGLEDQLAQVDDLLSSVRADGARPDHLVALQRERASLIGSLAQVRYAEVIDAGSPQ